MIILREADLPQGVTAAQAVALALGAERASEETVIVIKGDMPTPDPKTIKPVSDHVQIDVATSADERGQPAIEVLRSLCGKASLSLDTDDSGNLVTTELFGKPLKRTFKDIGEAIATVRARIAIGVDLDRQRRREAEEAAKGKKVEDTGIDYRQRLDEMLAHYQLQASFDGGGVRITGKPIDRVFPSLESACEFLRRRQV